MRRSPPPSRPISVRPKRAADPDDGGNDFLFDGLDTALTDTFLGAMCLFLLALERGERPLARSGAGAASGEPRNLQRVEHAAAMVGASHRDPPAVGSLVEHLPREGAAPARGRRSGRLATASRAVHRLLATAPESRSRPVAIADRGRDTRRRPIRRPGRLAANQRRQDAHCRAVHLALPGRRQARGLRHAASRALGPDGNHPAENLRPARQDDLGALRQHRGQRLRRGRDPGT